MCHLNDLFKIQSRIYGRGLGGAIALRHAEKKGDRGEKRNKRTLAEKMNESAERTNYAKVVDLLVDTIKELNRPDPGSVGAAVAAVAAERGAGGLGSKTQAHTAVTIGGDDWMQGRRR